LWINFKKLIKNRNLQVCRCGRADAHAIEITIKLNTPILGTWAPGKVALSAIATTRKRGIRTRSLEFTLVQVRAETFQPSSRQAFQAKAKLRLVFGTLWQSTIRSDGRRKTDSKA
jgi:hypothetical protein